MWSLHDMRRQPGTTNNNVASETNTAQAPMEEGFIMDAGIVSRPAAARQLKAWDSQSDPTSAHSFAVFE